MPFSVITHSGRAHMDEILAIALLMVRRDETPDQLSRIKSEESAALVASGQIPEDCWVIDCGQVYNPERRLYDHHQDRNLPSAALLIFHEFFPELKDSDLDRYFNLVSRVDTGGLQALDDFDRLGESREYSAFTGQLLTGMFESDPMGVLRIVAGGLKEKIRFEEEKSRAAAWLAVAGRLVDVELAGLKALAYTEQPPADIVDGLKGIDRNIIEEHGAAVVYGFDRNDPGIRTLYRTDIGHDLVDFTRARFADALFCHQGGFLARFRPVDENEWLRLIAESRLPDGQDRK